MGAGREKAGATKRSVPRVNVFGGVVCTPCTLRYIRSEFPALQLWVFVFADGGGIRNERLDAGGIEAAAVITSQKTTAMFPFLVRVRQTLTLVRVQILMFPAFRQPSLDLCERASKHTHDPPPPPPVNLHIPAKMEDWWEAEGGTTHTSYTHPYVPLDTPTFRQREQKESKKPPS